MLNTVQVRARPENEDDRFIGCLVSERYIIGRCIDHGAYGRIYKIIDRKDKYKNLVIKLSRDL